MEWPYKRGTTVPSLLKKKTLEKTEGAQWTTQKHTGNTWYTRHRTKTNKQIKHHMQLLVQRLL